MKILIIRLSSLGDILLTTPFIRVLRASFPEAQIDYLLDKEYRELLTDNPYLNQLIEFDKKTRSGITDLFAWARKNQKAPYDLIFDLQNKIRSRSLLFIFKGRNKFVYKKRNLFGMVKAGLGKEKPDLIDRHQSEKYLTLLKRIGLQKKAEPLSLDFFIAERIYQGVKKEFDRCYCVKKPIIGLIPANTHRTKQWPRQNYVELIQELKADPRYEVMLFGGQMDRDGIAEIQAKLKGVTVLCPEVNGIQEFGAFMSLCRIIVTVDTGPLHMASALKMPVVALFGPTSPYRWGPFGGKSRLLRADMDCSPCTNFGSHKCKLNTFQCMKDITVAKVKEAVDSLFEEISSEAEGT